MSLHDDGQPAADSIYELEATLGLYGHIFTVRRRNASEPTPICLHIGVQGFDYHVWLSETDAQALGEALLRLAVPD